MTFSRTTLRLNFLLRDMQQFPCFLPDEIFRFIFRKRCFQDFKIITNNHTTFYNNAFDALYYFLSHLS